MPQALHERIGLGHFMVENALAMCLKTEGKVLLVGVVLNIINVPETVISIAGTIA